MLATLAYYVHDLNPIIFEFGPIKPRWYGFAYLMGFLGAYLLIMKLSRDGMLRLAPERVPDMVLNGCIFGVLVGGRLGYCLFYQPSLLGFSNVFPYWGVLRVWEGGMSAHGGVVFTILTLIVFAKKYKASLINIGDAACMVVPIGLCFGRIANFINGELYGHETAVPWAVKFPSEIYSPTNGVMSQKLQDQLPAVFDKVLGSGPNWYTSAGFEEGLKQLSFQLQHHVPQAVQAVAEILPPRHPSQLYEALLEGVLLFIICWTIGRLWRKDGMASGAFLTFYPVMRIIGEQFRVGDSALDWTHTNLSAGVLLSLAMMVPAVIFWVYWIKKDRRVPWVPVVKKPTADEEKTTPAKV